MTLPTVFSQHCHLPCFPVQESYYQEISLALVTAFGRDTDGAKWTINFLLEKVLSNLTRFHSEPVIMVDTISLVVGICDVIHFFTF